MFAVNKLLLFCIGNDIMPKLIKAGESPQDYQREYMKNFLAVSFLVSLFLFAPAVVKAELVFDGKECNTDSYGNVTCRDKWHDSVTNIISYTNETVTKSTQTTTQTPIYNAGLPGFVSPLAAILVTLGMVSLGLKKKFRL